MPHRLSFLLAALALSSAGVALAAEPAVGPDSSAAPEQSNIDLVIELGAGGRLVPEYEGSDEYRVSPFPIIGFGYLNIPGLLELGSLTTEEGGLSVSPTFDYIGERKADDFDDLDGLDDVDATFEAGVRVGYAWTNAEVWGEVGYAFGGADGLVGGFGASAIVRPAAELELKAGPFATFASQDYMDAFFGVSGREAARTGFRLDGFDADGGFKSVGVAASARYEFRPDWFLNADASYSRLVGDAGDSPIVDAGSEDQFTFGLGLSRRFSLDLF